jgi:hypothetical protein
VSTKLVGCWADPMAKANWREGIDLVRSFMEDRETGRDLDDFGTPELAPAFVVDFGCVNTIDEFNNYRAPGSTKGRNVPELGQKAKDHAMDAIRYGLMHQFKLGANSHLADVYTPQPAPLELVGASATQSAFEPHAFSELHQGPTEAGYFTMDRTF